jgi:SIR2-like domain
MTSITDEKAQNVDATKRILERYPKELVLMRSQLMQNRLGLVLGAGFSMPMDFPSWYSLLESIAKDKRVGLQDRRNCHRHLQKGEALYQAFRENVLKSSAIKDFKKKQKLNASEVTYAHSLAEAFVDSRWLDLLTRELYKRYATTSSRTKAIIKKAHSSYQYSLISAFAKEGSAIINYNFDDSVELILEDQKFSVLSTWGTGPKRVPNKVSVYHPNGYLPYNRVKGSNSVTFLESSFQTHIHDSLAGAHAAFSAYLLDNTCLFIGISLDDPGLCHHLHQASIIKPGHVHFTVTLIDPKKPELTDKEQMAIRSTLFELYNTIALFLTEEEISALAALLMVEGFEQAKREAFVADEKLDFTFYLTGCVSSGKSSVLSHLSGFKMFGEWTSDMPKKMKDDPNTLTIDEEARVTQWVNHEVARKNMDASEAGIGLKIFDRCPLDAFAFTKRGDWSERAQSMRQVLFAKGEKPLWPGAVYVLVGDAYEMCVRSIERDKDVTQEWLSLQQNALLEIYGNVGKGVQFIDARGKPIHAVVKDVVRLMFFSKYDCADLNSALLEVESGNQ